MLVGGQAVCLTLPHAWGFLVPLARMLRVGKFLYCDVSLVWVSGFVFLIF
jgi:hypothetical protein